jgi:hypothetical protein
VAVVSPMKIKLEKEEWKGILKYDLIIFSLNIKMALFFF